MIRTDISSFYESVDRKKLIEGLDRDQLLSSASKKFIKQVLDSYGDISGSPNGIPRGVGISAYLSEIYLRPADIAIKSTTGLVLFCRYVDDIVAVFARPPAGGEIGPYEDRVIKSLTDLNLQHNPSKTHVFDLSDSDIKKFEYLGYRFHLKARHVEISPNGN